MNKLLTAMNDLPFIAILRGIQVKEVAAISQSIVNHNIRTIEVPMNSPNAIDSIEQLVKLHGDSILCGGGTVLQVEEVEAIHAVGGQLVISPNCCAAVIQRALQLNMIPVPGIATPTEAFAAIDAGAKWLKLFPAVSLGSDMLSNLLAVLPREINIVAVGGITQKNIKEFWQAGARGFGLGSYLYKAGNTAEQVSQQSAAIIQAHAQLLKTG